MQFCILDLCQFKITKQHSKREDAPSNIFHSLNVSYQHLTINFLNFSWKKLETPFI